MKTAARTDATAALGSRPSRSGWFAPMNARQQDWNGRTVWLVGASSGIGRATASALHRAGARVIVSARNAASLREFAEQHPGALTFAMDVCDPQAVSRTARAILAVAPLDTVLYCAGYYTEQRATRFNMAEMLRHQEVNYLGALHVLDAVLPHLVSRQAGHISLVSSVAGYRGLPKSLAYGPTKAALINLAETLYLDLRDQQIGVSLVCPGFVETPLTASNEFTMPALISSQQAADAILRGWAQGHFEIHFPRRFTLAMKLLGLLPFRLYRAVVRRTTGL